MRRSSACSLLYNIGGAFSLTPHLDEQISVTFVAISFYLAVTTIFFASIMLEDTRGRLEAIERGVVVAAVLASAAAMIGFFDIAGLGAALTRYDGSRATGMFKDPNVLGPFLVLPACSFSTGCSRARRSVPSLQPGVDRLHWARRTPVLLPRRVG